MIGAGVQILCIVVGPLAMIWLSKRLQTSFTSPIVLCFAMGIILRNFTSLPVVDAISESFSGVAILLALPLLLFSSDILGWLRRGRMTVVGFLLVVMATMISTVLSCLWLSDRIPDIWLSGGMLAGILTGGTPNLFAVGYALEAPEEIITITNSAEILCGAIYLLYILSIAPRLYGYMLVSYSEDSGDQLTEHLVTDTSINIREMLIGLAIAICLVGASVAISFLIFGHIVETLVIVLVTTLSVLCSFFSKVSGLAGPFELGDYMLLMFGVAVGMMSDFFKMINEGGVYVLLVFVVIVGTILLHLLLCRLCKVDRDTAIITATAAYFGPVFIPQVSQVLNNKPLLVGGIATSLVGLAIGNYMGIGVGLFLESWLASKL